MSIENNNPVNANYTNSRLVSKQADNALAGIQELANNNVISGANVLNLQKTVNDLITTLALVGQGNTGSNVGGGVEVFKEKIANDLRFRTLQGTNSVTVTLNGDLIDIGHPIEFLSSDPVAPVAPQLWFNYTDKAWRFWDGLTITEIASDYVDLTDNQTVGGEKTFTDKAFFSDEIEVTGKLTALGDFEVQGTLTSINSTDLEVQDSLITINKNGTDGSAENSGIEAERPSGNASIKFDSSLDNKWKIGLDSNLREVTTIIKGTKVVLDALITKYSSVLYYATDENLHYVWNGSDLKRLTVPDLAKGGIITHNGSQYVALSVGIDGKTIRADSANANGIIWEEVTLEDTSANIIALARRKGLTYYATDTEVFLYDTGTLLIPIGGNGFSGGVPVSAKGDLVTHDAFSISTLTLGSQGQRLAVNTSSSEGMAWKTNVVFAIKTAINALPRVVGEFYYATDEAIFYSDDGTSLVPIGGTGLLSGGGGLTPIASISVIGVGSYVVPAASVADITITQTNANLVASQQFKIFAGDTIGINASGQVLLNSNVIAELDTATFAITGTLFA